MGRSIASRTPPGPLELAAGTVLLDRYRVIARIGEGATGAVWAAEQLSTEREVAIKLLKSDEPADVARFLREAKLVARLSHPNIVQVFDLVDDGPEGPVFLVMERLRGETLERRLARRGALSLPEALAVLVPTAAAIRAAHASGIVHRDLKPANVFLAEREGEPDGVRVLDFGLARPVTADALATQITQKGALMGTPCYMAPEQIYAEKEIDVRADIWALGVVLYECLTGERPFPGGNLGQVLRRVNAGTFRPLRERAPVVPVAIEALVRGMLAHDRDRRPNAAVVCATLARPDDQPARALAESTTRLGSSPEHAAANVVPPTARITPAPKEDSPAAPEPSAGPATKAARIDADFVIPPPTPPVQPGRRLGRFGTASLGILPCVGLAALLMLRSGSERPGSPPALSSAMMVAPATTTAAPPALLSAEAPWIEVSPATPSVAPSPPSVARAEVKSRRPAAKRPADPAPTVVGAAASADDPLSEGRF